MLPGRHSKSKKSSESQGTSKKDSSTSKTSHDKGSAPAATTSKISPKQKTTTTTNSPAGITFNAKAHPHSTPLKQPHVSTSTPRKGGKNKNQTKDNTAKPVELQLAGISPLSKLNVPPEEKADQFYKHTKTKAADTNPSDIVKVENSEMYRDRGKLRPLRKSSHGSNMDIIETESEETMGETTEDDEEEPEGVVRHKRPSSDVVHCTCGDNADEGFMIQVRYSNSGRV